MLVATMIDTRRRSSRDRRRKNWGQGIERVEHITLAIIERNDKISIISN
jgi:hypothetical protein